MTRAKLHDGTVETFETNEPTAEWKHVVEDIVASGLTGSAMPFADVEFNGASGRVFTFSDIAEILDDE